MRWAAAGQPLPHCAFSPRRRRRFAGVPGQHAGKGSLARAALRVAPWRPRVSASNGCAYRRCAFLAFKSV